MLTRESVNLSNTHNAILLSVYAPTTVELIQDVPRVVSFY